MRAFIIRPFGKKKDLRGDEIDFDEVERLLIAPALKAVDAEGGTTIDIVESGNIRVDMFRRLLTADLVVADLTIHNANVFYELGVRHALRDRVTVLIRASASEVPFDLKTDRYLGYDVDAAQVSQLDSVEHVDDLVRVGRKLGEEVRAEHFCLDRFGHFEEG